MVALIVVPGSSVHHSNRRRLSTAQRMVYRVSWNLSSSSPHHRVGDLHHERGWIGAGPPDLQPRRRLAAQLDPDDGELAAPRDIGRPGRAHPEGNRRGRVDALAACGFASHSAQTSRRRMCSSTSAPRPAAKPRSSPWMVNPFFSSTRRDPDRGSNFNCTSFRQTVSFDRKANGVQINLEPSSCVPDRVHPRQDR